MRDRQISRFAFYLIILLMLWVMGRLDPSRTLDVSGMSDEALGVAPVYIASPVTPEFAKLPPGR